MYNHPLYDTWHSMIRRCYSPNHWFYWNFGGRGIAVCERWHTFTNFIADMGDRPEGMTLDRIKCNEDYSPDNCRWATWSQQMKNRRPWSNKVKPMSYISKSSKNRWRVSVKLDDCDKPAVFHFSSLEEATDCRDALVYERDFLRSRNLAG